MMERKNLICQMPVFSLSGYGCHARDIVMGLFNSGNFNISIIPTGWGGSSTIQPAKDVDDALVFMCNNRISDGSEFAWVQMGVPHEFKRASNTCNIGITAGLEVEQYPAKWAAYCNQMNAIIVPSTFVKDRLIGCGVTVPVYVVPEGVDTKVFNDINPFKINKLAEEPETEVVIPTPTFSFPTTFNFLTVGQWLPGNVGEDRKNIPLTILAVLDAFPDNPEVGIVVKTYLHNNSSPDKYALIERMSEVLGTKAAGRVHFVHGTLTEKELAELYHHPQIKASVLLTHGEGYCFNGETNIITDSGLKPIKSITEMDSVVTRNGRLRMVKKLMTRHYYGNMYRFITNSTNRANESWITPEHPVLIHRHSTIQWKEAKDVLQDDKLLMPKFWVNSRGFNNILLRVSNYVNTNHNCYFVDNGKIGKMFETKSKNIFQSSSDNVISNLVNTNANVGRLFGYYLAEGHSTDGGTVGFTFSQDEDKYVDDVLFILKSEFLVNTESISIHKPIDKFVNKVFVSSPVLADFLLSLFGTGAKNKDIHPDLLFGSKEFRLGLLCGLLRGDGGFSTNQKSFEYSSISKGLAQHVRLLLRTFGVRSNMYSRTSKQGFSTDNVGYRVCIYGEDVDKVKNIVDGVDVPMDYNAAMNFRKDSILISDYSEFTIKEIQTKIADEVVYNISVDEDETYCTEDYVVHNCRPLAEAAACDLPIIVTGYSGHMDFINKDLVNIVEFQMGQVPPAMWMPELLGQGQTWAYPDFEKAKNRLKRCHDGYKIAKQRAEALGKDIRQNWSLERASVILNEAMQNILTVTNTNIAQVGRIVV